jgi:hypothetical protein
VAATAVAASSSRIEKLEIGIILTATHENRRDMHATDRRASLYDEPRHCHAPCDQTPGSGGEMPPGGATEVTARV